MTTTDLPIEAIVGDLRRALARGAAVVLRAEPGAGKTTIVPLRLLDEPWLAGRRIVMLEPRRLAARAAARRMSSLLGEPVGSTVGYVTRDDRAIGPSTRIEVVTEGILTRRLQRDPALERVGLVILDEVHERNLQSDLSLAFLLDVRGALRPDLRLIAMSATPDTDKIASLLGTDGPAPVIASEGRSHPVDVRYGRAPERTGQVDAVAMAVTAALSRDPGDVLVFLAGAADIRRLASALAPLVPDDVDIRPLFGALSAAEQDAALTPSPAGRRRVVLSTDIAETSLTVAGVRVVIDAGEVRTPWYDPRTGLTRLRTGPISKASATQRTGRAGRTEPGVAYRLWSTGDDARRQAFAPAEIETTDLTGLALELALWGTDETELSWLDAPPSGAMAAGRELLVELNAIDESGRITPVGRSMAELPLHPRLAHMVVGGSAAGHGAVACTLAALLDERDIVRGRPDERPTDLADRVRLVLDGLRPRKGARRGVGGFEMPGAEVDRAALDTVRRRTRELARRHRVDIDDGAPDPAAAGAILALAYPDRIAQALGDGRFRLRHGTGASLPTGDPLTNEAFLVVASIGPMFGAGRAPRGGPSASDRIHLAAGIDREEVEAVGGALIEEVETLAWDLERDDLRRTTERRLGALRLSTSSAPPVAGDDTVAALVGHVRSEGLATLGWTDAARALRARAAFAHRSAPNDWPDVSDDALLAGLDDWLAPLLVKATGRTGLQRVDMLTALRTRIGYHRIARLDHLLPSTVEVASGRKVRVDYTGEQPSIATRAQDLYGTTTHPSLMDGRLPIVVHLLSPAGRPIQITADLPGFWAGSWVEVRKDMAGRYPKHSWPLDPAAAGPTRPPRRQA